LINQGTNGDGKAAAGLRGPFSDNGNGQGAVVVSVVIPAFQCAQYIAQAVDSVLQQSFSDFEIIVVNDGSPDTPQLEAALLPYWEKIRYHKQDTRGPSGARNAGILQARGKYVAFLDGDDYWRSDHLAKLMALFQEDAKLDLAYCDCVLLKQEKPFANAFSVEPQSSAVNFDSLLVERCAISTSSAVVSRESILKAGLFDENFRRCEDFDMWLRLSFGGARMAYHTEAQVFHRMNEVGLSADRLSMKRDRIRVYEKIAASLPVTMQQQETIHKLVSNIKADCHVDEMKYALERGNFQAALESGNRAKAIKSNWKLATSLLALRAAPRLFGYFYLLRAHMLNDRSGKRSLEAHKAVSPVAPHGDDPTYLVNQGSREDRRSPETRG
jgi:glycosyltransferase involved in cell wall biosynthesis